MYNAHKGLMKARHPQSKPLKHKKFVHELVRALGDRRKESERAILRRRIEESERARNNSRGNNQLPLAKRRRYNKQSFKDLPECRFDGHHTQHIRTEGKNRGKCNYCKYLIAFDKYAPEGDQRPAEEVPTKPKKVKWICSYCQFHLCKKHFNAFHGRDPDPNEDEDEDED